MFGRRSSKVALTVAALAAAALGPTVAAQAAGGNTDPTMNLPRKMGPIPGVGPHSPYVQEILINTVIPLKNQAIINRTKYGYLFRAGQQNTNLSMSVSGGRLKFVDTGTQSWKALPRACSKISVPQGVGATCAIQSAYTLSHPMLLEVWPRLGDDVVDSRALSAQFDVSFLGDKGNDTFYGGSGSDFFNGAQDNDRAWGGGGRDWIRTGLGNDFLDGGADGDYLVGVHNDDVIYGGSGDDRLYGAGGRDKLYSGDGVDRVVCGTGVDSAWTTSSDRANGCESLSRS
jgi:serralysin